MASAEIGLSLRSLLRWALTPVMQADVRTTTLRPHARNTLTEQERCAILEVCNSPAFVSLPPSQIVPMLADQDRYLASESTFYRVFKEANQQHRRGRSHAPHKHASPTRVSNDNPYSESLFRTLKYCPQWSANGFASLDAARRWVRDFIR